ncbi:HNH endonuclease [Haloarcula saliterrae]|uniref:HNH endonuclease n=1 Tax=Haloarcula saliterrae TaxID=2950534 RepID=UPI003AAD9C62
MPDYPDDWDRRRRQVYKRDNYECQNCGQKGRRRGDAELHAHHVVPKSVGGSDKLSNLITVCKSCHGSIHNGNQVSDNQNDSSDRMYACPTCSSILPRGDWRAYAKHFSRCELPYSRPEGINNTKWEKVKQAVSKA